MLVIDLEKQRISGIARIKDIKKYGLIKASMKDRVILKI